MNKFIIVFILLFISNLTIVNAQISDATDDEALSVSQNETTEELVDENVVTGQVYFNTEDKDFYLYDGQDWVSFSKQRPTSRIKTILPKSANAEDIASAINKLPSFKFEDDGQIYFYAGLMHPENPALTAIYTITLKDLKKETYGKGGSEIQSHQVVILGIRSFTDLNFNSEKSLKPTTEVSNNESVLESKLDVTSLAGGGVSLIRQPSTGLSGLAGLRLDKSKDYSNPHGISFSHDNVIKWDFGLDYENDDYVLAYNHREGFNGDIIRISNNNKMNFGSVIGSPEFNPYYFTFKVTELAEVNADGLYVEMADIKKTGIGTNANIYAFGMVSSGNASIKSYFNNSNFSQFVNSNLIQDTVNYGILQSSTGNLLYGGVNHYFQNGNVGIGVEQPEEKLEVYGNIKANANTIGKNAAIGGKSVIKTYLHNNDLAQFTHNDLINHQQYFGVLQSSIGQLFYGADHHYFQYGDVIVNNNVAAKSIIKEGSSSDDILLGDGTTTSLSQLIKNSQTLKPTAVKNGTELFLNDNITGIIYNKQQPSKDIEFSTAPGIITGGYAVVYIDTASATDFPKVKGATQRTGAPFENNTIYKMIVYSDDGTTVDYYFIKY